MNDDFTALLDSIETISSRMEPHLAGLPPQVQGVVLANLVSRWLAGHHPTLRDEAFQAWLLVTRQLVGPSEKEIFGKAGFPIGGLS